MQAGRLCTCMQTKHISARSVHIRMLSADRLDEAEDGSVDSLWSNDRGGSESCSMSFTWPVLRESRVIKETGSFELEGPRGEHRI